MAVRERRDDNRVVAQAPRKDRRTAAKEQRRERREERHRKGRKKAGASRKAEEAADEPTDVEFARRQGRTRFQRGRSR